MRTLFIITCLANIAFAFGTLPWMPEKAAIHFGLDGTADRFVTPMESAIEMSLTIGLLVVVLLGIPLSMSMSIMPDFCVNIPNRKYWLNEKNRPQTIRRLRSFLDFVGIGFCLLFLFIQWENFQANQRVPVELNMTTVWISTGIFVIFVLVESIRLHLVFRLPKGEE